MARQEVDRFTRARWSVEGLALGDAFGESFFADPGRLGHRLHVREVPGPPWPYTDDTQMALSIVEVLFQCGEIDQDRLADSFGHRFEPHRGYGRAMYGLLPMLRGGRPWRSAARALFNGHGSYGNGSAMRVGPLGAFFADDLDAVVEHAGRSAEVTHAHPEAVAGAIAVAAAAAWAYRLRGSDPLPSPADFLDLVIPHIPDSEVRDRTVAARALAPDAEVIDAIQILGNGSNVWAQDTVPFTLWCAARHLNDYESALWLTASGFGDIDTTCAIVGGIVAAHTGLDGLPVEWLRRREGLPAWPFAGQAHHS